MSRLLSVNVSLPKEIEVKGKIVRTGIFKDPVPGRVVARRLNLEGDGQADLLAHGGEQRAVYVYSHDHYAHWASELGRSDFGYGQFGENFTVAGMLDDEIHVGDQFRIGTALFEVTQPRVPCYKLAIKMQSEDFYSRMLKSGRLGFYFRVLQEGEVSAGDEIELVHRDPTAISIAQMNSLMYFEKGNLEEMTRALTIKALSPGWRSTFEQRLAKAKLDPNAEDGYLKLVVQKKVAESDSITSFYLRAAEAEPLPEFLPGQFLPIKLDIPGQYQSLVRTYSLSDSPSENYYRLSIKREPAPPDQPQAYPGVVSNYMHDQVDTGTELIAKPPRGKFFLDVDADSPVVLLSAGVGQTPLISMLNAIVSAGVSRQTCFIHGSRNGSEHAFGPHVRELAKNQRNISVHIRYSSPSTDDLLGRDYDDQGRVDIELVKRLVAEKDSDFYLCGPADFMESLRSGLIEWGVDAGRIHYEFFGPASALKRDGVSTAKRSGEIAECCDETEVYFSKSDVRANWNASCESLLDLAEANGLTPDYSCRSGVCHTCVCSLESGEVEYVARTARSACRGNRSDLLRKAEIKRRH